LRSEEGFKRARTPEQRRHQGKGKPAPPIRAKIAFILSERFDAFRKKTSIADTGTIKPRDI